MWNHIDLFGLLWIIIWIQMDSFGYIWTNMDSYKDKIFLHLCRFIWITLDYNMDYNMESYGLIWIYRYFSGFMWNHMDLFGFFMENIWIHLD